MSDAWSEFIQELWGVSRSHAGHLGRASQTKSGVNIAKLAEQIRQSDGQYPISRERLNAIYVQGKVCNLDELGQIIDAYGLVGTGEHQRLRELYDAGIRSRHLAGPGRYEFALDLNTSRIAADGFEQIWQWSPDDPLTEHNLECLFEGPRAIEDHGVDDEIRTRWNELEAGHRVAGKRGSVGTITAIGDLPYGEVEDQKTFRISVGSMPYSSQLATRNLLGERPDYRDELRSMLHNGGENRLSNFIHSLPPSAVAANLAVVSSDGQTVLVQRGPQLVLYPRQWNLGVNETMKHDGTTRETPVELVRRGFEHELGLKPGDLDRVVISWFGYCFDCANWYFFAQALSNLTADEIVNRMKRAKERYESYDTRWKEFSRHELQSIVDSRKAPTATWLHHARLSADELWTTFGL